MRCGIARIGLRPRFQRLHLPVHVAGDLPVVHRLDVESLGVARAMAQLVRLDRALPRQRRLSLIAVKDPELRMGDREVRVDRDRTLEQRLGPRAAG